MQTRQSLHTFSNKLPLVTVPMDTQSVAVLAMVGVGSRYETRAENGLSHFLEHMPAKGSKSRPTAREIAGAIEGVGGAFNAYTGKDRTVYWIKVYKKHIKLVLEILSDMLLESLFEEKEIEREKGVITEEINMYEDTPMRRISEEYERLMYGDTSLGRDIAGTKESVKSFKRNHFLSYMHKWYVPSNSVIAIAGAIPKDIRQLVQGYFGSWKDHSIGSFEKIGKTQTSPRISVISKKTEQTHLCLGVPALPVSHKKRYVLTLLTVILGGGMSSRLFHQVRERRGLAYYVHSETSRYKDLGNFVTQAGVETGKVKEAISVIRDEYEKIASQSEKIEKSELTRCKELIKGHFVLGLEDSQDVAEFFGSSLLLEGAMRTTEEVLKGIDHVTAEEIHDLGKELFQSNQLNLAVIGPFKNGFEKELQSLLQ